MVDTGSGPLLGWGALHMLRSLWCAAQMGHFWVPQSPYIWVHFWQNVLRIGSYILSSSLQLGSKQHISSDFGNQRYLIGVIDTGCICGVMGVMRFPPGDYCDGWLGIGDMLPSIKYNLWGAINFGLCIKCIKYEYFLCFVWWLGQARISWTFPRPHNIWQQWHLSQPPPEDSISPR